MLSFDTCYSMCYDGAAGGGDMKSYSSREILKMLVADGWYEIECVGSHHQFRHPTKPGKVTLKHPVKDIPPKTLRSIEKQSGLKFS